jgi:ArsR family transcriptional regulator
VFFKEACDLVREQPTCRRDPRIIELAEGLKTLCDPSRLRIICFLSKGEACVCDIEQELGISQQLTSHHLNVLKDAGFLRMRKEATRSLYSIDVEYLKKVNEIFAEYVDWRNVAVGAQQVKAC